MFPEDDSSIISNGPILIASVPYPLLSPLLLDPEAMRYALQAIADLQPRTQSLYPNRHRSPGAQNKTADYKQHTDWHREKSFPQDNDPQENVRNEVDNAYQHGNIDSSTNRL